MIDSAAEVGEEILQRENRQALGRKGYVDLPQGQDFSFGFFADSKDLAKFFRKVDYHSWVKVEGNNETPSNMSQQEVELLSQEMSRIDNEIIRKMTADNSVLRYLFMRQEFYKMLHKVKISPERLMDMNPETNKLLARVAVSRESGGASPFLIEKQFIDLLPSRDQIKVK